MKRCHCCGRLGHLTRVDGGDMHFDCWAEHHSHPDGPWPPEHACALEVKPIQTERPAP